MPINVSQGPCVMYFLDTQVLIKVTSSSILRLAAPTSSVMSILVNMIFLLLRHPLTLYYLTEFPWGLLALSSSESIEPTCKAHASKDLNWHVAMADEFNALICHWTQQLVVAQSYMNLIGCNWVSLH